MRLSRTLSTYAAAAVLSLAGASTVQASSLDGVFDVAGLRPVMQTSQTPQWSRVIARSSIQQAEIASADCDTFEQVKSAPCRLAAWDRKLAGWAARPAHERIDRIHRAVNRLAYVTDAENWGRADHWETPLEMFERGGDCEGFALTKYFALRATGHADADMRIAVVWDNQDQEEHAVLLVRVDGAVWMLDNKMEAPERAADHAARYRLIYYLNEGGVRLPEPASIRASATPRVRLTNGGRTLVMQVRPRNVRQLQSDRGRVLAAVDRIQPAGD
ncbi:transglutaminase-like cysteine peptidase [Brevundimonas sp.]|uniref:transglutaminase-like cysteine peptidase n=1 Tax=Brevundimonas sp. TaxID=1871086 RepID=UPI0039188BF4